MLGVAGSFAAQKLFSAFLFGVSGSEPFVLAGSAALLGSIAAVATYFPARRASRIDPAVTLKVE